MTAWFFSDGLCYANRGGRAEYDRVSGGSWGYLDRSGRWAIDPQWASKGDPAVASFSEGLAAVLQEGQWGYINTSGEWVVKPRFAAAGPFSEGLAAV